MSEPQKPSSNTSLMAALKKGADLLSSSAGSSEKIPSHLANELTRPHKPGELHVLGTPASANQFKVKEK